MLSTKFLTCSSRLNSFRTAVVATHISKIFSSDYHGCTRLYANKLLSQSTYTASKLHLFHPAHLKESRTVLRTNQTSSDQDKNKNVSPNPIEQTPEKLNLFQRYKKMLKEYWYVLLPVHGVTSAFWFGGFYYAAKSGLDIVPFLEFINVPEKFIEPLRNSSLGYIAVATAFYKIATPARYMVTLGGTTFAVKFLTKRGLIRPAPTTKDELKSSIKTIQNKLKKKTSEKQS